MRDTNLVNAPSEHAEWARANEWETPITLGDDLVKAADRIEAQAKEIDALRNELCLKCGKYTLAHDGACNGNRLLDQLVKYEDTELTPEEVSALVKDCSDLCTIVGECGGIDRVRKLAEADRAGRLVALPCKVGDTVWAVSGKGKTVFLTYEEAEKALEAMKDGNG